MHSFCLSYCLQLGLVLQYATPLCIFLCHAWRYSVINNSASGSISKYVSIYLITKSYTYLLTGPNRPSRPTSPATSDSSLDVDEPAVPQDDDPTSTSSPEPAPVPPAPTDPLVLPTSAPEPLPSIDPLPPADLPTSVPELPPTSAPDTLPPIDVPTSTPELPTSPPLPTIAPLPPAPLPITAKGPITFNMKLLLVGTSATDTYFLSAKLTLDSVGAPYDVIFVGSVPELVGANGGTIDCTVLQA